MHFFCFSSIKQILNYRLASHFFPALVFIHIRMPMPITSITANKVINGSKVILPNYISYILHKGKNNLVETTDKEQ